MSWILVMYIYAGVLAKGDSVTLQTVPGFKTQQECQQAGNAASSLVNGSAKEYRFVCVAQSTEVKAK
jgi:hypothetical protein